MEIQTFDLYDALSKACADYIIKAVTAKPALVLGLATGATVVGLYRELVAAYQARTVSFAHATSFNLDEYWGIRAEDRRSFHAFMHKHLFGLTNFSPKRTHLPDGTASDATACANYETFINAAGGIDMQILGIGLNGHLGFNEPGSAFDSRTRLVELSESTRTRPETARFFAPDAVPTQAITMGLATIMEAREIILLASGLKKAAIVATALKGPITESVPASILQQHPRVTVMLDDAAAGHVH